MNYLKRLIPRDKADKFGVSATIFLLLLVTWNNLVKLNKTSNEYPTYSLTLLVVGLYVLFNVFANMYKAISVDTTIYAINLPVQLMDGWRYCSACELNAPPRSNHCYTCDKCVLKRHNHCMFLGKCAGHRNLRFYLFFILYVWLGSVISNVINYDYYLNSLLQIGLKTLLITFVPWLAFILGMVGLIELAAIFANSVTLILFFLVSLYGFINFRMAFNGQTWFERSRGITAFKLSWRQNLLEVFGTNWFYAMLWPFAPLKLPSDGSRFRLAMVDYNSNSNENSNQFAYEQNQLFRRKI